MSNSNLPEIVLKPSRTGLEKFLGSLEAKVMDIIWQNNAATVKRVLYFLSKERKYAYTTIMTVMNRLTNKSFLTRKKVSHAYHYKPTIGKAAFIDYAIKATIDGIKTDFPDALQKAQAQKPKKKKPRKKQR